MKRGGTAPGDTPAARSLEELRDAAAGCTRCDLYRNATQVVVGEGRRGAALMFVGEQPGDQEDLSGRPFVGPAGRLLDRALGDAAIDREDAYVTNAVKHFKFERRGKRRLHKSPNAGEIDRCRWWLDLERAIVAPSVIVALGGTAARSLCHRPVTISRERGVQLELPDGGGACVVTVHPSYLLRLRDEAARETEYRRFVDDLIVARKLLGGRAVAQRRLAVPADGR